jgi:outer membrane receptor protein involved in Fe transport
VAVALDANQSLLRAYLGKAYFEEKRAPLDAEQWAIAKQLDPLDPTAYLYSGIALQTENRPVEALRDLERSIKLNDNRAVYRSRLLLDQDRAAREVSHARVFNDLGFGELGINEARASLARDPANASAHRFLSDSYLGASRRELSRVSELQQAQMLQQVNINPIQPSLKETNLNIVTQGGPAAAGFNEFTPLFERNRLQLNASVLVGSNRTEGAEALLSGIYDRFSVSAGSFLYDTDGFRPNNDLDNELYNFFGQVAATPNISLQIEHQQRDSDYGDLDMNFDPWDYSPNERNRLDTETTRLGVTFRPSARTTLLMLYNHKQADYLLTDYSEVGRLPSPPFPPGLPPITLSERLATDEKSDQLEGTLIHREDLFNVVAGAGYTSVKRDDSLSILLDNPLAPAPIALLDTEEDQDSDDLRGYVYGNFFLPHEVVLTVGGSYQEFEKALFDFDRFNPKLGLAWEPTEGVTVRGAYFQVVKPALSSNRTLEPTQIAGFNQFFDDLNATRSERYGLGIDWRVMTDFAMGLEWSERNLKIPAIDIDGDAVFEDQDEETYRAYAYWTPSIRWALTLEGVYDTFRNAENSVLAAIVPDRVRTVTIPAKATYFHPSGLFGTVGATYVDQEVARPPSSTFAEGQDSFALVDLAIGYRLPQRRGILSIAIHNVFDEQFYYQDNNFREFADEPSVSPYTPERLIMARVMVSF